MGLSLTSNIWAQPRRHWAARAKNFHVRTSVCYPIELTQECPYSVYLHMSQLRGRAWVRLLLNFNVHTCGNTALVGRRAERMSLR